MKLQEQTQGSDYHHDERFQLTYLSFFEPEEEHDMCQEMSPEMCTGAPFCQTQDKSEVNKNNKSNMCKLATTQAS